MNQQDRSEKVRENRLRRMADRQGLALRKSRQRDPYHEQITRRVDSERFATLQRCHGLDRVCAYLERRSGIPRGG